ncbi:Tfp assembly type protein [Planococcus faecalis]|uniref:Tfp assembly type protein n=1 Tax=Planococcus faecalis TaxID=1598147 RepID=A0ABM6IRY6_9BACL|nr:prepilin-type N-terminal cleavage/methylation domain-containing protein [Planococcus faecalis]AQU79056.1 Tfp assembly type protein [Planococcus faecalis]
MKKYLQNKLNNEKGMTLIELLAVIVIIAIIAAIAIPAIGNIIENSRYSAVKADATNVLNAAQLYYTETPEGPGANTPLTVTLLKSSGFVESEGKIPVGSTITKDSTSGVLKITTTPIDFSGSKKIKFTAASIKGITGDTDKGSAVTGTKEISN